ncbi:hypothetical protein U1Q18_010360 [Sarracenia purpurea var. burkii]
MVFLLRSVRGPILPILSMALTTLELKTEESPKSLENCDNAIPERESIAMACLEELNEVTISDIDDFGYWYRRGFRIHLRFWLALPSSWI